MLQIKYQVPFCCWGHFSKWFRPSFELLLKAKEIKILTCRHLGGSGLESRSGDCPCQMPRGPPVGHPWPEALSEASLILPLRDVAKQHSPQPLQGDFKQSTYRRRGPYTMSTEEGTRWEQEARHCRPVTVSSVGGSCWSYFMS